MRELKFRAYDSTTGKVSEPFDVKESWGDYLIDFEDYSTDGALDSIIWEQYTGLKDKNGKEIYEGDIVNFMVERFDSITLGFDSEQWHTAVVEWNQDDACYSFVDGDEPFSVQFEAEVIGNIHENPELLGEEKA